MNEDIIVKRYPSDSSETIVVSIQVPRKCPGTKVQKMCQKVLIQHNSYRHCIDMFYTTVFGTYRLQTKGSPPIQSTKGGTCPAALQPQCQCFATPEMNRNSRPQLSPQTKISPSPQHVLICLNFRNIHRIPSNNHEY